MSQNPPDLPTNDSNPPRKKHGCLKVGIIGAVVLLVLFSLAVVLGTRDANRMSAAAEPFFAEIKAGNLRQAYELTSPQFQEKMGFEDFDLLISDTGITKFDSADWRYGSRGEHGDEALEGTVLTTEGVEIPLRIDFVKSGEERLISHISRLTPEKEPSRSGQPDRSAGESGARLSGNDDDKKKEGWSVGFSWSTARISNLRFVTEPRPGTDPAVFSSAIKMIKIAGDLKFAPSGTKVDVVWILEKSRAGDITDLELMRSKLEAGSAELDAYIERTGAFLYPGDWRVKILLDGKEKASLPFKLEFLEEEFLDKAGKGDADSQLALGLYYLNEVQATPIEPDPENAAKWLRASAAQGNATAQFAIAELLLNRPKLSDSEKAEVVDWLQKSSGQGNVGAQVLLGTIYQNGEIAERDLDLARKHYLKAAEQNHPRGQVLLGMLMLNFGNEEMHSEGIEWVRKAAEQGESEAILVLGQAHKMGLGVPRDPKLAREYFQKAADAGRQEAIEELKALDE